MGIELSFHTGTLGPMKRNRFSVRDISRVRSVASVDFDDFGDHWACRIGGQREVVEAVACA